MSLNQCFEKWREHDRQRDSVPGEHAWVALAGLGLIVSSAFARHPVRGALRAMLGGALLVRAASGRDGLASLGRGPRAASPDAAGQRPAWRFPTRDEPAPVQEG